MRKRKLQSLEASSNEMGDGTVAFSLSPFKDGDDECVNAYVQVGRAVTGGVGEMRPRESWPVAPRHGTAGRTEEREKTQRGEVSSRVRQRKSFGWRWVAPDPEAGA